ncbi:formylglycine-generating enzyme family protein [uncultured Prevotella sp.]|uniref:formylglycine-generating enzyme family protein n=1 Tax=uncultured Prevotella sp. TaxID=159272 RepID=UPI00266D8E04|nr:formylglycine-generating enzyme family protein [uncultured Prevotella sp.]
MRKTLLSIILFFATISSAIAQKLTVESFKLAPSDLTAQTQPRKDTNNYNCAVVKVLFVGDIIDFGGNIVKPVVKYTNETWVYMPQRSRQLKITTKDYLPLMVTFEDYGVDKLESNRTYVLTLVGNAQQQAQQSQTLTIRYSPSIATVLVDNKMINGSNGVAQTTLPVGQHSYIVACNGYESEEGMVKLKASAPSNLQIKLTKEKTAIQQSNVSQPTVAQQPVVQPTVKNSDNISIPVKDGISIDMVRVEAGTFTMGATPEMEEPCGGEKPTHQVTLTNDYYIGKYEVTQALWQAVMGSNPSAYKGESLPVERVSWNDCQVFISKLNRITGKTFRLPTEAEWEYAARGGKKGSGHQYSGSSNLSYVAWYEDNSGSKTHAVGSKQANELGIYDMTGNVYEWCQDWYDNYSSSSQVNPTGANSGVFRMFRGGGWFDIARCCRLSYRRSLLPDERCATLGLRLVLSE